MHNIVQVFRKEFNGFFASPAAWLFLGAFLIINLFIFFWGEAFFARNIADLKPLFQWMPVLLIFLVSALSMRSWSEERRSGTLESLLTSPVSPLQLVLGKFFAGIALVALALVLTLPLPFTVSAIGSLDWGPVFGGYIASLFLAAAYISIGLYMSARTDNPIVALILTVAVAGGFYLIGSNTLTSLFGHKFGGFMELLGSGSRFESITRGVFDIRDIYYYLSIVGVFLTLNLFSLERFRWAGNKRKTHHKQWGVIVALAIVNFVLANFWLNSIGGVRIDLTKGNIYSLSSSTKGYMSQLREPLLIRGYFSDKSHPLLEPLVPQIKDLLKEYQVAGGDNVRVEFIDPHTDQALEEEAAEKYGIRPVPFRMASRYQSGVVNSYFDLIIAYGDQHETLSFGDLIEVKSQGETEPEVLLKNPEYEITRALKKVANAYQAGGDAFANLDKPLRFSAYISPEDRLPKELSELSKTLKTTLDELKQRAGDKLNVEFLDPDANEGALARQLKQDYGFGPQIANLFDPKPFWFYMLLNGEDETIQVPLPNEFNKAELKKTIQSAVQRMAPGYLKTIAIVTPPIGAMNPMMMQMGRMPQGGKRYEELREALAENVRLKETDLKDGLVPVDADLLLLLAPEALNEKQLFAVDQFLMRGGSIVIASSPYDVDLSGGGLNAKEYTSGLQDWLKHHGLAISDSMVLDPQNASLPVPVRRNLGRISVQEIQMMPYPHFPDLRDDSLNQNNMMTSALGQLTLNWASPIEVDKEKNQKREVIELLNSSAQSWTSDGLNVLPDYRRYPKTGFEAEKERGTNLLAVAVKGDFESFYKDKESPLLDKVKKHDENSETNSIKNVLSETKNGDEKETKEEEKEEDPTVVSSVIERSSDSARIILLSSNTFASDSVLNLASQGQGTRYTRPLEFVQNAIDWALGDQGLLAIRSRAQFARTLKPLEQETRLFWEYTNYGLAFFGLLLVWLWRRLKLKRKNLHYQQILAEV